MRLKLAVSQTECASKLGISQTHLSNIEHGRSGITLQMLCRVCDILQVSLDYLVRRAQEKNRRKKSTGRDIELNWKLCRVIKMLKGIEENKSGRQQVYHKKEQTILVSLFCLSI